MPLTLKQLRYFLKVVDTGSISRASEEINVAQTALGLQIKALEQLLGVKLLERHSWGVTPTQAGRLLYEGGRQLLAQSDELKTQVRNLGREVATIRIGLPPSLSLMIGPEALVLQQELLPDVRLGLVEGPNPSLLEKVLSRDINYAIAFDIEPLAELIRIPVVSLRSALVTRPGLNLPPGPISFTDALDRDLVLGGGRSAVTRVVEKTAKDLNIPLKTSYSVESIHAAKGVVLHGDAASILNFALVEQEVAQGVLEAREIVDPPIAVTGYLIMLRGQRPTIDEGALFGFLDMLLDRACERGGNHATRLKPICAAAEVTFRRAHRSSTK